MKELELSAKDFAAIKAVAEHEHKVDLEYSKIVREKVDLLLELVHSLFEEQVQLKEYLKWSEPILIKLSFHCFTLLDVFKGTDLRHKGTVYKVFDEPSVFIIFRTILENYLTFYYLFVDKISDDEKVFRINVYRYAGLKQRCSFVINNEEAKQKQALESLLVEELKEVITATKYFSVFNKDDKKAIIKGVKPRLFFSWDKLIRLSGFREELFKNTYGYKSNYSHSEFISILQINSNSYGLDLNHKEHFTLFSLHMLICKTIIELSDVFPSIKLRFDEKNASIKNEVEFFYQFAVDSRIQSVVT